MRNLTLAASIALVSLLASTAHAQRLSIADFKGPGASAARNQLVSALCDDADCVAASKTTTHGKPDWKKAKKEAVGLIIGGTVAKKGKARTLKLELFTKPGAATARRSFPLEKNGTLSATNTSAAAAFAQKALGAAAPKHETAPAPTFNAAPAPTTPPPSAAPAPTTTRLDPEPEPEPAPVVAPEPAPKPKKKRASADDEEKFLAVELGVSMLYRDLDYTQAVTPNLRSYSIAHFPQLDARVEVYPLRLMRDDAVAGLGLDFGIGAAPYLSSQRPSVDAAFPTSTLRLTGGLRYRWMPFDGYRAAFIPMVGVNVRSFTLKAAADGTVLDGLPNVSYVGLRAGLGVELPIIGRTLGFFGRFCVIPAFSSGQLISSDFFADGSTLGLEGAAGLSVGLASFLSVRAAFEFERYGSTFKTEPTDTYVAAGATDGYLGGSIAARLEF